MKSCGIQDSKHFVTYVFDGQKYYTTKKEHDSIVPPGFYIVKTESARATIGKRKA